MTSPVELRCATAEETAHLHRTYMRVDFPPEELKPLPLLLELVERGVNSVWLCESGGELVGYAVLAQESAGPSLLLLDYLAVLPQYRGMGFGSGILRWIGSHFPTYPLLIESEHPNPAAGDYAQQQRRLRFYEAAGGEKTHLRSLLFGVDYDLLLLGGTLEREAVRSGYLSLYREMLPEEWFQSNVAVFAEI